MTGREELEKSLIDISKIADNLQERIDKAIEYIENHSYGLEEENYDKINDILDILKGSDK